MEKFFIEKHIKNKRNIILSLIFFFITLAIILLLTIAVTFTNVANNTLNHNMNYRTIKVNGTEEYDDSSIDFNNIKHVIQVEEYRYADPIIAEVKEFSTDINGEISLKPILIDDFKIVKGRTVSHDGEAICSSLFYPYEIETNANNKIVFNKKRLLNINKTLNKNFNVESQKNVWTNTDEKSEILNFKIVGFYDFNTNNTNLNTCYITKDDFIKLQNPYRTATSTLQEDGSWSFVPEEYSGKLLIVDKAKNVKYVLKELQKYNLNYIANYEIGKEYTIVTLIGPIIISILLIIAFIFIMRTFLSKKIIDNSKYYAILKSIGYSKKEIMKTSIIENVIILTISISIVLIIYPFIFYYIKYNILQEYFYDGTIIKFSFIPIIITILIMYSITIVTNKRILNKKIDSSISEILK